MSSVEDNASEEKALFDGVTTLGNSSDGETITSFEDQLRRNRVYMPMDKKDKQRSNTSQVLWETQAFCVRAKANLGECATDTHSEVSEYLSETGKQVKERLNEFFSEENQRARAEAAAEAASKAASSMKLCISSCNDQIDTLLVRFFDQPLSEVEIRSDNIAPNESITIDHMTDAEMTLESVEPQKRRSYRRGRKTRQVHPEYEMDVFLAPTEEDPVTSYSETEWEGREEAESELANPSTYDRSMDSNEQSTEELIPELHTASSDDSVLRFKEALYRQLGDGNEMNPPLEDRYVYESAQVADKSVIPDLDDSDESDRNEMPGEFIDLSDEDLDNIENSTNSVHSHPERWGVSRETATLTKRSGSKRALVENPGHVDSQIGTSSMPSFNEEHETIDCSWIEERDDEVGRHFAYGRRTDQYIEPIDLTMYHEAADDIAY